MVQTEQMEETNKSTVEDVKVEGTGETKVATETKAEVNMISKEEAQEMVNKALAKKLPPKEEMEAFIVTGKQIGRAHV